jgi:hypothetical protein
MPTTRASVATLDYNHRPADLTPRMRALGIVSTALAVIGACVASLPFVLWQSDDDYVPRMAVLTIWGVGLGAPVAGMAVAVVGTLLSRSNRELSAVALIFNLVALGYVIALAWHFA